MSHDRETIRFDVLRNALYHTARRRGLERYNRFFNLAVILLGAAAIGDLAGHLGIGQMWIGATVAFIGALQLVFDFGRQARDHQALQRDYYLLLSEIEKTLDPDKETLAKWYSQMIRITADEPPTLRAVDSKAYNDAIDVMEEDFGPGQRLHIPWWHRVLGHTFAFEGYNYRKMSELGAGTGKRSHENPQTSTSAP